MQRPPRPPWFSDNEWKKVQQQTNNHGHMPATIPFNGMQNEKMEIGSFRTEKREGWEQIEQIHTEKRRVTL